MAELVIKNGHVYIVDRGGDQHFEDFVSDACSDYAATQLEYLAIALKKSLVHVEEQVLLGRHDADGS